jgi:hypothetical protein
VENLLILRTCTWRRSRVDGPRNLKLGRRHRYHLSISSNGAKERKSYISSGRKFLNQLPPF